jgi:tetratricopeptide (TPR) repeat protein
MSDLTIGLLSALLATNQPQAVSNVIQQQAGVAVNLAADPVESELRAVMIADEDAQDEVDGWIQTFSATGTNATREASQALSQRIRERFEKVRTAYGGFLRRHPDSAHGFLAYGSFLNDIGDPDAAKIQYENSKQLDPKNPAVWNQLANYYGEFSPVTNAFAYYTEAIRLAPDEPVYYQNFATTVYLFRSDAREFFHLDEQQVFDKSLGLYRQAMQLAPADFVLATDYAESYYGIQPLRTNDALAAWTNALAVAPTGDERQGVEIHLARVKIAASLFDQASNHLAAVTNVAYLDLKNRLYRSLADHLHPATNSEISPEIRPAPAASPVSAPTNVPDSTTNLLAVPPPMRATEPR